MPEVNSPQGPQDETVSIDQVAVPHSGVDGHERPVDEFNTSLQDAVDQGLVGPTPDTTEQLRTEDILTPAVIPTVIETGKRPWYRKPLAVVAGAATLVGAGIGVGVAASGGSSDSEKISGEAPVASADAPNPVTQNPAETGSPEKPVQTSSEFLATPEKSPEQALTAHIELEALAANTMHRELIPYIFYDANENTNPHLKEYNDVIDAISTARDSIGPEGITIKGVRHQSVELTPEGIKATSDVTELQVYWDNTQKVFYERTVQYTQAHELRQKDVGGKTVWTLFSNQQLAEPVEIGKRIISREEGYARIDNSFDELHKLQKELNS